MRLVSLITIISLVACLCHADQFYASPVGGGAGNDGSISQPWRITYALDNDSATTVGPGDTINLRGGYYVMKDSLIIDLQGIYSNPIVIRSYPTEWAEIVLDTVSGAAMWGIWCAGSNGLVIRDFEVRGVDYADRYREEVVDSFRNLPDGFDTFTGDSLRIINLIIHDVAQTVTSQSGGRFELLYGIIAYNFGNRGYDRWSSHGFYIQNDAAANPGEVKVLDHLISIGPQTDGNYAVQIYGSDAAYLEDIVFQNSIYSGNPVVFGRYSNSEMPQYFDTVRYVYSVDNSTLNGIDFGYVACMLDSSAMYGCIIKKGATMVAPDTLISQTFPDTGYIGFYGNYLYDPVLDSCDVDKRGGIKVRWPNNVYPTANNLDTVVTITNEYDSDRLHIVISNMSKDASVKVKVTPTYSNDDSVDIFNAYNITNEYKRVAVVNDSISITMDSTDWTVAPMKGLFKDDAVDTLLWTDDPWPHSGIFVTRTAGTALWYFYENPEGGGEPTHRKRLLPKGKRHD